MRVRVFKRTFSKVPASGTPKPVVHRGMSTTRYEVRDNGSDYTITVADPTRDLPAEVLGWFEAGEAKLIAIAPDGSERVVCGA